MSAATKSLYDFELVDIDGNTFPLSRYKGSVLVLVNVASKCGLTPQYVEIQEVYDKYKSANFEVLGFPANNFGNQEPGTDAEIKQFCTMNYGVTFPVMSKISVKGDDQHALYKFLTEAVGEEIRWNFQKIVIDKEGRPVKSIDPQTSLNDPEVLKLIDELLAK